MDWQTIETAPKDGTRILVVEEGCVFACVWGNYYPYNSRDYSSGWVEFDGQSDRQTVDYPTHWMPLPAPPGEENEMAETTEASD